MSGKEIEWKKAHKSYSNEMSDLRYFKSKKFVNKTYKTHIFSEGDPALPQWLKLVCQGDGCYLGQTFLHMSISERN